MAWFSRDKPTASSNAGTPGAGWFPDPSGSGRLRYWDGSAWTDHFSDAQPASDPGPTHQRAKRPKPPRKRSDGKPFGRPVPPWSENLKPQDIVGESFHEASFQAILKEYGYRTLPEYGAEITEARAAIVRDPENQYDPDAVAVWIDGRHLVGHLPRHVSAQYGPWLEKVDDGTYLEVPARVWVGTISDWNERTGAESRKTRGSVTVRLPEPEGVIPFNDLPDEPYTVLPWGRAVQVSGEENHMEILRTFALGSDPRHVAATLHVVEEQRRSGGPVRVVEVRLDGQRVGSLSKTISDQTHDLVTFVTNRGRAPVARAIIKGSDLRADVTVHLARTSEVKRPRFDAASF